VRPAGDQRRRRSISNNASAIPSTAAAPISVHPRVPNADVEVWLVDKELLEPLGIGTVVGTVGGAVGVVVGELTPVVGVVMAG
jgi:hypothetical protein